MAHKRKQGKSNQDRRAAEAADQTVLERVQELTWAMLDEQISDDEFHLLESLLLSDDEARDSYIGCVQLHTNLMANYAKEKTPTATSAGSKSPMLGFLNDGVSPFGLASPADQAKS